MNVLFTIVIIILGYCFLKVVDAWVLPIYYCINGEIDIDSVNFVSYIPFEKKEAIRKE